MTFAAALRRATDARRPSEALAGQDVWVRDHDDALGPIQPLLEAAASLPEAYGSAIVLPRSTLAFAVLDAGGRVLTADQRLSSWAEAHSEDPRLQRLLKSAVRGGAELGVLPDERGHTTVVCVVGQASAERWPLPSLHRKALQLGPDRLALATLALPRSSTVGSELESLFGLTVGEARVLSALLNAPTVKIAAAHLGMKPGPARDALTRARRKLRAANNSALTQTVLRALLLTAANRSPLEEAGQLGELLGLTLAESRVALLVAEGMSARAAAAELGVTVETVKSHLRAAFSKTGVNRSRQLGRIALELRALDGARRVAEVVTVAPRDAGRLRLMRASGNRTVACIDYGGSADARPLFVCHGFAAGRTLPKPFVMELQERGWRPLVPQRPGYGLTDARRAAGYFETAADDMAVIVAGLRYCKADVLARDSAAPALFALCDRHPDLVDRAALLNPKSPQAEAASARPVLAACSQFLMRHPAVIEPFVEMLRRQLTTELVQRLLLRACQDAPSDQRAIADPSVMDHLVTDIQALMARSSAGAASEQSAYVTWRPSRPAGAHRWAVGFSRELDFASGPAFWSEVLGVEPLVLEEGGYLTQFTHPQTLIDLLDASSHGQKRGA